MVLGNMFSYWALMMLSLDLAIRILQVIIANKKIIKHFFLSWQVFLFLQRIFYQKPLNFYNILLLINRVSVFIRKKYKASWIINTIFEQFLIFLLLQWIYFWWSMHELSVLKKTEVASLHIQAFEHTIIYFSKNISFFVSIF